MVMLVRYWNSKIIMNIMIMLMLMRRVTVMCACGCLGTVGS